MKKIGVVGIGNMGRGIIHNLLQGGFEVMMYSRHSATPSFHPEEDPVISGLMAEGGLLARSIAEAGRFADAIITSVPMPEDFKNVCMGADGLLENMRSGTYIIDTSTIDVETTRFVHAAAAEKGIRTLDAPVSGGPSGAMNGTMTVMVGGDEEDFLTCGEIFRCIGGNINYMGKSGTGQMIKLCNQALSASQSAVLAEVFVTGVKAGLKLEDMRKVISASSGDCWMLDHFWPDTVFRNVYDPPRFALRMMHKDVDLYMRTAKSLGVPSIVSGTVLQMYNAAMAMGNENIDATCVVKVVEELGRQKIVD